MAPIEACLEDNVNLFFTKKHLENQLLFKYQDAIMLNSNTDKIISINTSWNFFILLSDSD
jgi:hypothetical protein